MSGKGKGVFRCMIEEDRRLFIVFDSKHSDNDTNFGLDMTRTLHAFD